MTCRGQAVQHRAAVSGGADHGAVGAVRWAARHWRGSCVQPLPAAAGRPPSGLACSRFHGSGQGLAERLSCRTAGLEAGDCVALVAEVSVAPLLLVLYADVGTWNSQVSAGMLQILPRLASPDRCMV